MKRTAVCLGICLGLGSMAVFGADGGWYAGASVGQSISSYSQSDAESDFGYFSNPSLDEIDTGWKLFGGYRFDSTWGVEFGFADFGETKISGVANLTAAADKLEASGGYVVGTGTWAFTPTFALIGKAGIAYVKGEYTCIVQCSLSGDSQSKVIPTVGVGIQYDFTKSFGLRADLDYVSGVEYVSDGGVEANYGLLTVGGAFKF